jgi:predicted  nucleic acid-binding Zn-ribbon protein
MMIDYNALLIDMLQEKIQRLEHAKDAQRKEINRLKKELREAKKEVQANEQ